jgi:hypothetical protein
MADKKISALPAASTPLTGTEVLPIVQGGATDQVSVANLTAGRAISAAQLTLSTDNLIIGTAGKGIDFSAATHAAGMTSELLNDYEEGTFTPVITAQSGSITSYVSAGYYVKIGGVITVYISYTISDPGTASGLAFFAGLPFTSKNAGAYIDVVRARDVGTGGGQTDVLITSNATGGLIFSPAWSVGTAYNFSATYLTA